MMRLRSLVLFALTVGLTIGLGTYREAEAQTAAEKKAKRQEILKAKLQAKAKAKNKAKNKNAKNGGGAVAAIGKLPEINFPELKPVTTAVPVPAKKDTAALAKLIDAEVERKLKEANISASPICSDDEFLRRVYLDIAGVIPTADQAREFLDSTDANKREKLIDELLANPGYGRRMADIWTAKLFTIDSNNRFVLKEPLYKWLEEQFNGNLSWDKMVTELVTAKGSVAENPAVTYFMANRSVDKLTDTTTQHFLGIQLQCAQCHNHPFTDWKQTEYWGMAEFYSKVRIDRPQNANRGGDNTQIGVVETVNRTRARDFFPEAAKEVPAKFLGGDEPKLVQNEAYRPALAAWMTNARNPFFAKAIVNRTWAHLFGRGFVNPIDDLLEENIASHPELLNALAQHLATTGEFDLKYFIKAVCLSDTYQRTSKPTESNKDDKTLFSHMIVKVMTPEQLFDSLTEVTGFGQNAANNRQRPQQNGRNRNTPRDQFVTFFLAGSEASSTTEYEAGIPQALRLMNSPITNNPASLRRVVGGNGQPAEVIERIYLSVLSRRPTADEKKMLIEYINSADSPATAYGDIAWATLNSSEFTLVR